MPTMILTFVWLLASTTHLAAAAPASQPSLLVVSRSTPVDQPILVGRPSETEAGEPGWLLFEADNDEETDDETETALSSPLPSWPAVRTPFGVAASNPHPTVLPCSALRCLILRC